MRVTKDLTGSVLIKALTGLQLILQQTVLLILLLARRYLQTGEKTTGLLQLIIRTDLQNVLVLTGLLLELTDLVTTMCFT